MRGLGPLSWEPAWADCADELHLGKAGVGGATEKPAGALPQARPIFPDRGGQGSAAEQGQFGPRSVLIAQREELARHPVSQGPAALRQAPATIDGLKQALLLQLSCKRGGGIARSPIDTG